MNYLELIILGCTVIWGVHMCFHDGMILFKVSLLLERLPIFLQKPLYTCPICMSSIWGTVIFFSWSNESVFLWPFYVVSLAGINYLLLSYMPDV